MKPKTMSNECKIPIETVIVTRPYCLKETRKKSKAEDTRAGTPTPVKLGNEEVNGGRQTVRAKEISTCPVWIELKKGKVQAQKQQFLR